MNVSLLRCLSCEVRIALHAVVYVLQLIHIYSVPTNEVVALAVTDGQSSPVSLVIQSLLHIDQSDQELLMPTGAVADLNATDLSQYCSSQVSLSDLIALLLYLI